MDNILSTPLRIYTAVWGDEYIELFEKTIIKSFGWPQNKKALNNENVTWSIHTNKKNEVKVIQLIKRIFDGNIEVNSFEQELEGSHPDMGKFLLAQFKLEIKRCLDTNSRLLLAPPDSLFGDGSLAALFNHGAQDGVCVAVAHPRVLDTIFEYPEEVGMDDSPHGNAQLVSSAFRNLHKTWSEAQLGFEKINSFVGGVCWKQLKKGLYSVQHRLPTTYLISFQPNDLQFFEAQICFGAIDHLWPSKLIAEQRQRTVGSSDSVFICEITKAGMNMPPLYPVYKREPDKFWRDAPHNQFFRQVNVIFRGVEA